MDEQEKFWSGNFGNEYTERNNEILLKSNIVFFSRILKNINVNSIFEIGCNRGLNLQALKEISNDLSLYGLEINEKAFEIINSKNICEECFNTSVHIFETDKQFDLVFTKGVLIHINSDKLENVYDKMYKLSKKYILIAEYYSRDFREIKYRGNDNKLFKRDFCGEMMNKYKELKLIDYGFVYYRDSNYPQDDITWFLLEKPM